MINIYDTANQLERDIRTLPEYQELKQAFETVRGNDETKALYEEFRKLQMQLQQKMMTGDMPTEEEQKQMQELGEKVQQNKDLETLLSAEQKLSQLMDDINRIILKPLQEVYGE